MSVNITLGSSNHKHHNRSRRERSLYKPQRSTFTSTYLTPEPETRGKHYARLYANNDEVVAQEHLYGVPKNFEVFFVFVLGAVIISLDD